LTLSDIRILFGYIVFGAVVEGDSSANGRQPIGFCDLGGQMTYPDVPLPGTAARARSSPGHALCAVSVSSPAPERRTSRSFPKLQIPLLVAGMGSVLHELFATQRPTLPRAICSEVKSGEHACRDD
jgi:hypothetical protein